MPHQARLGGYVEGPRVIAEVLEGGAGAGGEGVAPGAEDTRGPHTLQTCGQGLHATLALGDESLSAGLLTQFATQNSQARVDILQTFEAVQHHQAHTGPSQQGEGLGAGEAGGQHQVGAEAQDAFGIAVLDGGVGLGFGGHGAEVRVPGDVAEGRDLTRIRQGQQQLIRAHGLAYHPLRPRRRQRQRSDR